MTPPMERSPNTLVEAPREISTRCISWGAKRSQYTQPPKGSFSGMPSQITRVRLAPEPPTPRRDTPCVVGFATMLDVRRNSVKPGTSRRRSSRFTPGVSSMRVRFTVEISAGASVESVPVTVMLCFNGSIFRSGGGGAGCCVCCCRVCCCEKRGVIGTKDANVRIVHAPTRFGKTFRRRREYDLKHGVVIDSAQGFPVARKDQSKIFKNSVDIRFVRAAQLDILGSEDNARAAPRHGPGEVGAALDCALEPGGLIAFGVD